MKPPRKFRFSMSTAMLAVVTAALASAVFARARAHVTVAGRPYLDVDVPAVFVISIALTALAFGALKAHSAKQVMLQMILAYLGYFSVILLAEAGATRPLLYWVQAGFFLQVVLPLIARSYLKAEMGRGPRRAWWKKTTEAVIFSFFTIAVVMASAWLQWLNAAAIKNVNNLLGI